MPATPAADATAIRALLGAATPWTDVRTVAETGSTNADLARLAREGADAGVVLVSEHQTAGRGRFDRVWQAPPGSSVAVSVLLRPTRGPQDWSWLPPMVGLAVLRGVREASAPGAAARVVLKWPNDVLVEGQPGAGKLCGILCERHESPTGPAAVLGMGLNIDLAADELPVPTATSLAAAGLSSDKDRVLALVLSHLAELYQVWQARGHLREAYVRECGTLGRRVRVQLDDHTSVSGRASDVDETGRLVVQTTEGPVRFVAGDVFHLRPDETAVDEG